MSENLKLNLIATIENIIITICFTVLAIIFNHWWIVLFAGLFYSRVKNRKEDSDG